MLVSLGLFSKEREMGQGLAVRSLVKGMFGQSLCRFSIEFPANWPEGNEWVPHWKLELISCTRCKSEAEILLASKVGT